jgi:hypothetical protein
MPWEELQPQGKKTLLEKWKRTNLSVLCLVIDKVECKNVNKGWVMLFGLLHCQLALTNKHNPNLIHSSSFHPWMKLFGSNYIQDAG